VTIIGRNFGPLGTVVTAVYTPDVVFESAISASSAATSVAPAVSLTRTLCLPLHLVVFLLSCCVSCVLSHSASDYAVYGVDGGYVEFPGVSCSVVSPHLVVNCTTVPGAGSGLNWILAVGNQTSQSPVTSYMPPSIASFELQHGTGGCRLFSTRVVHSFGLLCSGDNGRTWTPEDVWR
jgi:hypothetical protein